MGLVWGGPYTQDSGNPTDNFPLPAYPANARGERVDQGSWMSEEHDPVNGRHKFIQCTFAQRAADISFGQTPAQTNAGMILLHTGCFSAVDPTNSVFIDYGTFVTGDIKLCAYNTIAAIDGWLACTGQAVSRTTYANLFAAITFSMASNQSIVNGTAVTVASTAGLCPGLPLFGTGVFTGATVASITSGTVFQMSHVATATGTSVFFAPFGNGDASTTFNVPNMGGVIPVGYINGGDLSDSSGDYAGVGAPFGSKKHTLVTGEVPGLSVDGDTGGTVSVTPGAGSTVTLHPHGHASHYTGGNTGFDNRQPCITIGYLIK